MVQHTDTLLVLKPKLKNNFYSRETGSLLSSVLSSVLTVLSVYNSSNPVQLCLTVPKIFRMLKLNILSLRKFWNGNFYPFNCPNHHCIHRQKEKSKDKNSNNRRFSNHCRPPFLFPV